MRNQSQKIHARAVRVISSGLIPSPPRSISGMTPLGTKYAAVQKSIVKKRMPAAPSHLRRDNAGRLAQTATIMSKTVGGMTFLQNRSIDAPALVPWKYVTTEEASLPTLGSERCADKRMRPASWREEGVPAIEQFRRSVDVPTSANPPPIKLYCLYVQGTRWLR